MGYGCQLCDGVFTKMALWKIEIRKAIIKFHNDEGHKKHNWTSCDLEPCKSISQILEKEPDKANV